MQELLTFLAKSLVENPDEVKVVDAGTQDGILTLKLSVAPSDMGKVIGKQGRIAKAIRTVIKAAAVKENLKVNVEIVDVL